MLNIQTASAQLLFSTVRIECDLEDGSTSVGTAFFFNFRIDESGILPLLVTNKHVVKGATTGRFHVHEATKDSSGSLGPAPESFTIELRAFENEWFMHPDPAIDLCGMLFEPLRRQAEAYGKVVFNCVLDDSLIPGPEILEKLAALEDVVMVGYPSGLWDSVNNFPILRRGVTASHPAVDFMGEPRGVVDMACFPGSSGSPIVILNDGAFATSGSYVVGSRIYLLGVLFGGPVHRADGNIEIVEIPTRTFVNSGTNIPIHLGYYIKASALATLKQAVLAALKV